MSLTVDQGAAVCTLLNTFEARAGEQAAIVACLRAFTEDFASGLDGFVGAAVHASRDGTLVVNYVQWRSEADLRAMLATGQAQAHMRQVGALALSVAPVLCDVAYAS